MAGWTTNRNRLLCTAGSLLLLTSWLASSAGGQDDAASGIRTIRGTARHIIPSGQFLLPRDTKPQPNPASGQHSSHSLPESRLPLSPPSSPVLHPGEPGSSRQRLAGQPDSQAGTAIWSPVESRGWDEWRQPPAAVEPAVEQKSVRPEPTIIQTVPLTTVHESIPEESGAAASVLSVSQQSIQPASLQVVADSVARAVVSGFEGLTLPSSVLAESRLRLSAAMAEPAAVSSGPAVALTPGSTAPSPGYNSLWLGAFGMISGALIMLVMNWAVLHSHRSKPSIVRVQIDDAAGLAQVLSALPVPVHRGTVGALRTNVVDLADQNAPFSFRIGRTFAEQQSAAGEQDRFRAQQICATLFAENLKFQQSLLAGTA